MKTAAFTCVIMACCAIVVAGENIALNKPYTLQPAPHYKHCTDPGDREQITDGQYTEGYFWTQTGCVGWSGRQPVTIIIDLQKVQPIAGVSFSTAAGVAGVQWPLSIQVLTSDDGKQYHLAGDLVQLDAKQHDGPPPVGKFARYRYQTNKLNTRGRYVALLLPVSGFIFVDEVEVFRGDDALMDQPPRGRIVDSFDGLLADMAVTNGVHRRLRDDLAAVRAALDDVKRTDQFADELVAIEHAISSVTIDDPAHFRAIMPFNDLHRRIFALQAAAWRATGMDGLHLWQTHRWDPLSPTQRPGQAGASIDLTIMRGAYRSGAFNLSNTGEQPTTIRLTAHDVPGLTVHEALFTDTKSGVPVAAALPPAKRIGSDWVITIAPGMSRQIWLTFHPEKIEPGVYTGRIDINSGKQSVPVTLRVLPLDFPKQTRLNLGGWDYTDGLTYNVTQTNRDAFIEHLKAHFVNAPWARRGVMAPGIFDEQGRMTTKPDTAACDAWLDRWPNAKTYCVFMSFGDRFASFDRNTPAWRHALTEWAHFWAKHFRSKGIEPNRVALLLVDEPHEHEQDQRIIDYAKVITAAEPELVIWEDPTWRDPTQALPGLFEVSDVLCPNTVHLVGHRELFTDFYGQQRAAGKRLWLYSCSGPGRLLDPYAYELMQGWFCFALGAEGSGYWAFGDSNGASSWNEYLAQRGAYTPLFIDDQTVTPGKHMEAIRESVEDYEILCMLRDRVRALTAAGVDNAALNAARKLLTDGPGRVIGPMDRVNMIFWSTPKDRSIADAVRREALDLLMILRDKS